MRRPGGWWGARTVVALLLTLLLSGGGSATARAGTNPLVDVPQTGADGSLALQSSQLPLRIPALTPGQRFSWQIAARLDGQPTSELWMQLVSDGSWAATAAGYHLAARLCPQPWVEADGVGSTPRCAADSTVLIDRSALSDIASGPRLIGALTPQTPWYAAFTVDLPGDSTLATDTGEISVGMGFTASGAAESGDQTFPITVGGNGSATVHGSLSWTGFALLPFAAVGLGAIMLGLAIAGLARRIRREPTS